MILRKLAESIRSQDWFVVIIEILIVVVGIFLGLQVDDWNQQRKDRADEQVFLERLHRDLELADEMSARVRERRLGRLQDAIEASDVLFNRTPRDHLTDDECLAVASATFFNINVAHPASIEELTGTGRLHIIEDRELRQALIELRQASDALSYMVSLQTSQHAFTHLPTAFPDLIRGESFIDEKRAAEVRTRYDCNLSGMRASNIFMNQWSANLDGYDAYVRDGLRPWLDAQDRVHSLVDAALNISHSD